MNLSNLFNISFSAIIIKLLISSWMIISISSLYNEDLINISNYDYPKPDDTPDNLYYIPIISINDIHGTYFPSKVQLLDEKIQNQLNENYYKSGGIDYLGKYISIMKEEWKDRLLFLNGGDDFQGGLESKLSNGSLITESLNIMNCDGTTLGNHEWDYGPEYLFNRIENSTFPFLACNLYNTTSKKKVFLPNQLEYKIYKLGEVNIGVIGLANKVDKSTSGGKFKDVDYLDYYDELIRVAEDLRPKVNAIVVLGHVDLVCPSIIIDKYKLQMYNKSTEQSQCNNNSQVTILLKKIYQYNPNLIDAFVAGHSHDQTHHWLYGFPVMSHESFAKYTSIMYLPFDKKDNYKLIKDKIQIEGPIPLCERIFEKSLRCDEMKQEEIEKMGKLKYYTFHNKQIEAENKLKNLSDYWYNALDKFNKDNVTFLDGEMEVSKRFENEVGNLYADVFRKVTGSDVAILNPGNFRVKWNPGNLTAAQIIAMTPFDNRVCSFEIKGKDLKKMLFQIQGGFKGFYQTSGIKQVVKIFPKKQLISVKMFDGVNEYEIENGKIYKIATLDFLYPGGGDDFVEVVKWLKHVDNLVYYGADMKYDFLEYLRNMKLIQKSRLIDEANPRLRIII